MVIPIEFRTNLKMYKKVVSYLKTVYKYSNTFVSHVLYSSVITKVRECPLQNKRFT